MEYRICENGHEWLYKKGKQEFCPHCGSERRGYCRPREAEVVELPSISVEERRVICMTQGSITY
jgi:hypothetical protein